MPVAHRAEGPLRLLILTDTAILGSGGSERFLRNLLSRLSPEHYAIDVVQLIDNVPPVERIAEVRNPAVSLRYLPVQAIYGWRGIAALRRLRREIVDGDYDVVQSQHEKSDLINALAPRRARAVRISNRRDMGFQKTARVRLAFRLLNGRFDRIVAPTPAILDKLVAEEGVDRARCLAIPNGVDAERFRGAAPGQREAYRRTLGLSPQAHLIACVASFSPVKRHCDLIDAFARLRAKGGDVHLMLIGDGALQAEIETQVAALGVADRVHFLGTCNDIDRILPCMDAFVLASSTEGLSNAILEAQACALPVVATDVGGNRDLVRPGDTGILVAAFAPDALAQALGDLLGDDGMRARYGAAARARVEASHSLDAMANAYATLYRELIDARS